MKVVVPFTHIEPGVLEALSAIAVTPELVDVSGDDEAYWRLLDRLWAAGEDFMIVEQDIVVNLETISSFATCDQGWCAAGYAYLGSDRYHGNGCTRYRAEIMQAIPELMDDVATHSYPPHPLRHWCILDAAMQRELHKRDRYPCTRHGIVTHVGDPYPAHGCIVGYPGYRG